MARPTLLVVQMGSPSSTIPRGELADVFRFEDVFTAEAALRSVAASLPALVVFDSHSADAEAINLCRALRSRCRAARVPMIIACASCAEADRIRGFQFGIDDYFCAPLSALEVRERILAMLRRSTRTPLGTAPTYTGSHLVADFEGFEIRVDGALVDLTKREFDLLHFLVEHRNRVLTRQELLDGVWHSVEVHDRRTVDTHIRRLRVKLGAVADQIQTLPGRGYRFAEGVFAVVGVLQGLSIA